MSEQKGVEAVERAFRILECFAPDEAALTLAQISARTGFYKSTILRLAVSLEKYGYLLRKEDGRFQLGATLWKLGAQYRRFFDLSGALRHELRWLSAETMETASYYIAEGDSRVCLLRAEPDRAIRHALQEGTRLPMGQGASGKILTAFQSGAQTGAQIRAQGYAISMGERDAEVAALAVPILNTAGEAIGALSLSGLIFRFTPDRQETMLRHLKAAQDRLMAQIAL